LALDGSWTLQQLLYAAGRVEEAEAEYRRSVDLPGDRTRVESLALLRAVREGYDRATIEERRQNLRVARSPDRRVDLFDPAASLDDRADALLALRRELARAPDPGALSPFTIAQWADYYGDTDLALQALAESFRLFGPGSTVPWDGALRAVRATQGFKDLMRSQGYESYWRQTGEWGDYCHPTGQADFECS
jgi:hypothetical protein